MDMLLMLTLPQKSCFCKRAQVTKRYRGNELLDQMPWFQPKAHEAMMCHLSSTRNFVSFGVDEFSALHRERALTDFLSPS
jgi:hypothetical protein